MRARLPAAVVLAFASVLLFTACSDGSGTDDIGNSKSADSASSGSSTPDKSDPKLHDALARISDDAANPKLQVEFGDQQRLAKLATDDSPTWGGLKGTGASVLVQSADYADKLSVKLAAADYAVSVGPAPGTVTLIAGGQDTDAVASAAQSLGYSGDEVLSQEMDVSKQITVGIQQVKAFDDSVELGGGEADLSYVDPKGETLADDAEVAAVSECLGDVSAAYVVNTVTDDHMVGVGVADDNGAATSVICIQADDESAAKSLSETMGEDLDSGTTHNGKKYDELFDDGEVKVVEGDVVCATMPNADGVKASTVFSMLMKVDLPGL